MGGTFSFDRIRELSGSDDSCENSAFTIKSLDFSVSASTFTSTSATLTFQSSPAFTFTETFHTVTVVGVTAGSSGAACSAGSLPYPLEVEDMDDRVDLTVYDTTDYELDLLEVFTGDENCTDFERSYSASFNTTLQFELDPIAHTFKVPVPNYFVGLHGLKLTVTFPVGVQLTLDVALNISSCEDAIFNDMPTFGELIYYVGDTAISSVISAPSMSYPECDQYLFYTMLFQNDSTINSPPFTFAPTTRNFDIYTTDPSHSGVVTLKFIAAVSATHDEPVEFEVTIACKITLTYTDPTTFDYKIGVDSTLVIDMGSATYDSYCESNGGSTYTFTAKLSDGNDLPAFIAFDNVNREFTVMTTDYLEAGTYTIKLNATLDDPSEAFNDELEFTIEVTNCANAILSDI